MDFSATEIERSLRHPGVRLLRPVVRGGVRVLESLARIEVTAHNAEVFDDGEAPYILAANHQSHFDTPAILESLPPRVERSTLVAAAWDTFGPNGNPLAYDRRILSLVVRAGFRAFPFDRGIHAAQSLRATADLVCRDWSLLMYPEGTRSRSGIMAEFKHGIGWLGKATGRAVVPVKVTGSKSVLGCGKVIPKSGKIDVTFGTPIACSDGESYRGFTKRIEDSVRTLG